MLARWYEAMGGDGLEVQRDAESEWCVYGLVVRRCGGYDVILNRHEESFSIGLFQTKQKAMECLLKRSGATLAALSDGTEPPTPVVSTPQENP